MYLLWLSEFFSVVKSSLILMAAKTFNQRMRSFRILLCLLCTAVHCTFTVHGGKSFIPVFIKVLTHRLFDNPKFGK